MPEKLKMVLWYFFLFTVLLPYTIANYFAGWYLLDRPPSMLQWLVVSLATAMEDTKETILTTVVLWMLLFLGWVGATAFAKIIF